MIYGSHLGVLHNAVQELPKHGHEIYTALGSTCKEPAIMKQNGYKVLRFHYPTNDPALDMPSFMAQQVQAVFNGAFDWDSITKNAYRECELFMEDEKFTNEVKALKNDLFIVDYFPPAHCLYMRLTVRMT